MTKYDDIERLFLELIAEYADSARDGRSDVSGLCKVVGAYELWVRAREVNARRIRDIEHPPFYCPECTTSSWG